VTVRGRTCAGPFCRIGRIMKLLNGGLPDTITDRYPQVSFEGALICHVLFGLFVTGFGLTGTAWDDATRNRMRRFW
jgi:hypothetical protein